MTSVHVAALRVADGSAFFPGVTGVPVQAGRMVQATPAEFAP
ncbi:MAG: hypothetical protein AB1938_24025 [Myxococcota bacterium]